MALRDKLSLQQLGAVVYVLSKNVQVRAAA
jgi:hypothetical protein